MGHAERSTTVLSTPAVPGWLPGASVATRRLPMPVPTQASCPAPNGFGETCLRRPSASIWAPCPGPAGFLRACRKYLKPEFKMYWFQKTKVSNLKSVNVN